VAASRSNGVEVRADLKATPAAGSGNLGDRHDLEPDVLDSRHSDRVRSDRRLARRASVRLLVPPSRKEESDRGFPALAGRTIRALSRRPFGHTPVPISERTQCMRHFAIKRALHLPKAVFRKFYVRFWLCGFVHRTNIPVRREVELSVGRDPTRPVCGVRLMCETPEHERYQG
jgi:hypothetical protein